jgi:hypothetical protein
VSLPPFVAFPPIPRFFKAQGCVITEKLDGTNALVHIGDDGTVTAGSRNRWVTPEADNFGWARWVADHAAELALLGPGYHYGEWWGLGIQRRYDLAEKRFSLFNVSRWQANPPPPCCGVVPVLYRGVMDTSAIQRVAHDLAETGSHAAPGFMKPEGIVVHHFASKQSFKFTFDGDGHKSAAVQP